MAQQYQGPDGTIYEEVPGGGYRVVPPAAAGPMTLGTPDPNAALDRTMKTMTVAKALRDAARAPVADARDDLALQRDRLALEKDRRDLTKSTARPLRDGDGKGLEDEVSIYGSLKNALGGFQPDFAGNSITGSAENLAQGVFNTGTPGQRDWWANFYQTDNLIRNKLFGASLTDGEKAAYASTTISPSMTPSQVQKNLARRTEIVRSALGRKVARFKAGGYNPQEIDAAIGEFGADLAPGYKPAKAPAETADKTTSFYLDPGKGGGTTEMSAPTGATRTETDPALKGVNDRVNQMLRNGTPDDKIIAYMGQAGVPPAATSINQALDFRKKNPAYKGSYQVDVETKAVPQSGARQAFQAVGSGPVGSYATAAADALTAGRLDNIAGALGGNSSQVDAAKALLAKANPMSSLAGSVTGGALATAGAELGLARSGLTAATGIAGRIARSPIAADVGYGAAMGADDPEHPVTGALMGGALGYAGGRLGQGVARGVGGVRNEAVQRLNARGIPLTLGQAVGQSGRVGAALKWAEDGISGIPLVGSLAQARRAEGLRGFNLANARQAADGFAPITEIGERGAEQLDQAVTNAYRPLDPLSARVDPQLGPDLAAAAANGQRIPGRADDFNYVVNERVAPNFDANGVMTGRNYQDSIRGLRQEGANQGMAAMHPGAFTGALDQVGGALTGMFQRQAPEAIPILERANRVFRHQSVIDAATRAAKNVRDNGDALYTPAQLNTASVQNATRFGGADAATTTERPFFQEIADAQEVLPSRVPDSGTASRLALTGLLAGGGAGAGYAGGDTTKGAAAGTALAALQTQVAQRALVAAVLNRPRVAVQAADFLERYGIGSAIGAPAALQALPSR